MTRDKIYELIEINYGESIEESSKNGILAHSVDVDGLTDDIQKALNVDLANVSKSAKINNCTNCKHYVDNHTRKEEETAHYCKVFNCLCESILFECNEFEKHSY